MSGNLSCISEEMSDDANGSGRYRDVSLEFRADDDDPKQGVLSWDKNPPIESASRDYLFMSRARQDDPRHGELIVCPSILKRDSDPSVSEELRNACGHHRQACVECYH
jgi:hypothetical protein